MRVWCKKANCGGFPLHKVSRCYWLLQSQAMLGFEILITRYRNVKWFTVHIWVLTISIIPNWWLDPCSMLPARYLASILTSVFRAECSHRHEFSIGAGSNFLVKSWELGLTKSWVSDKDGSLKRLGPKKWGLSHKVGSLTKSGLSQSWVFHKKLVLLQSWVSQNVVCCSDDSRIVVLLRQPVHVMSNPVKKKKQYYL